MGCGGRSQQPSCKTAECATEGGAAAAAAAGGTTSGSGGTTGGGGGTTSAGGADASYDDCKVPNDCVVLDRSCCSTPNPALTDLISVNYHEQDSYQAQLSCMDLSCPGFSSDVASTRRWFGSTCESGHCVVFDARESPATACEVSDDCELRQGLGCCGNSGDIVAVNKEFDLFALACGDPLPCAAPVTMFPAGYAATCVAGRCVTMAPTR
jgi:hypothetical protein